MNSNCKQLKKKLQRVQICTTVKSLEKKYLNKKSDVVDNIMTVIQKKDLQKSKKSQQKQEQTKAITKAPEFKQLQPNVKQKLKAKQRQQAQAKLRQKQLQKLKQETALKNKNQSNIKQIQSKENADEKKLKNILNFYKIGSSTLDNEKKQFLKNKVLSNPKLLSQDQTIELFEGDFSNQSINQLRDRKAQEVRKKKQKQAQKLKQKQAQAQAQAKQLQANELKKRKQNLYKIFQNQSGNLESDQISLLDDYFKGQRQTVQKIDKEVIIRFYNTYSNLQKPNYFQTIKTQIETQKRKIEQQKKRFEQEQAKRIKEQAQAIKKKEQQAAKQAEARKKQIKKSQMEEKLKILDNTNNIDGLVELLNNEEYSIIKSKIDDKLDKKLEIPKKHMIELIKMKRLTDNYVESKYPNVQKLKMFHAKLKLIEGGKKPSQEDEILTDYYNYIENMKNRKKTFSKNKKNVTKTFSKNKKNVKDDIKIETTKPRIVKYGIDMTPNSQGQRQKMEKILEKILKHKNRIQSETLKDLKDDRLNTMKTKINQNLNNLETGNFNNREFDDKKETYKKFYTKKLQEIQTQIQKRQQQKRQQQIQNKNRQQQNQLRQKQIQNLKQKKIKNMTEEQKTKMKDFLDKDRTLVEGSELLELYKDEPNKPDFVKQIQEQFNAIKKKPYVNRSQKQKQFLKEYRSNSLVDIPGVTTVSSEPSSSISKQTQDQYPLSQQDKARLIKSLNDRENREAEFKKSLEIATAAARNR